MPQPNQTKHPSQAWLKQRLRKAGVQQQAIAAAAGVTKEHVCNVLAGRDLSQRVIQIAKQLLVEARQTPSGQEVSSHDD